MRDENYIKMNYKKSIVKPNTAPYGIEAEKSFNKHLENLYDTKNFDKKLFEKGVEYFNNGGSLDDLDSDLANNRSFVTGFNHAKRLALVEELEGKRKSR